MTSMEEREKFYSFVLSRTQHETALWSIYIFFLFGNYLRQWVHPACFLVVVSKLTSLDLGYLPQGLLGYKRSSLAFSSALLDLGPGQPATPISNYLIGSRCSPEDLRSNPLTYGVTVLRGLGQRNDSLLNMLRHKDISATCL
jgi:hypothetical protein